MIFKINLATRIYINTRVLKACSLGAVVLLLFLLFVNISNIAAKTGEIKNLTNQIAAMDEKFKASNKGMTEKEYSSLPARISFANATIEKKMYNWLELLDKLELVVPDGVAVSSIDPDMKSQALRLSGVARSFKNLRVFMEHLEDSKFFTEVYLLGQSDIKLADATQGISFNLSCKVVSK